VHCRGVEHSIAALRGAVVMVGFFIQRPIFASAIAVIMVLAGSICYFLLPVSQFPDITPPQVVVSAVYPGASAQVVADTVTTPLEQQINGVAGMTYMSSSSSNDGSSTITITFDVGYPLSIAAVDVQNRVAQAASSLPPIVNQARVTIKKQNPNFVLIVNLTSPDGSVDPVALSNYAYLQIVDPLKRLSGVGDIQIFGERRYSMRIWLDPDKLVSLGITAVDVQNAVAEQNVQVAAGKIGQSPAPEGTSFELQVNAVGRLSDPAQFGDIVVRANADAGSVVRLRDAARPIPFALNPLHDERTDLDGAPSGRPGRAWVCCGIARIGYRHHHCPTLGGLGDALRDLLREMVGAELGEVLLGDRHDLRLRQERPADRVLGARTADKDEAV
jgi:multidrug efflux pump subunit AcrB